MGCKISTTLKKFESLQNKQNRELLEDFYRYRQSLDHRSGFATNNILTLMISLDKFLNSRPFTEVVKKEQILEFLDHKFVAKEGKWVKRAPMGDSKIEPGNLFLPFLCWNSPGSHARCPVQVERYFEIL
jgi:hypothetical protein